MTLFTNGLEVEGITNIKYKQGGAKWGRINVRSVDEAKSLSKPLRSSYELIKAESNKNESTGWHATLSKDLVDVDQ